MVSRRLVLTATLLLLLACSAEAGWGKKKQAEEVSLPPRPRPSGGAPPLDRAWEARERAGCGGLVQRMGALAGRRTTPRACPRACRARQRTNSAAVPAHARGGGISCPAASAANRGPGLPHAPRQAQKPKPSVLPVFTLPLASKVLTLYAVTAATASYYTFVCCNASGAHLHANSSQKTHAGHHELPCAPVPRCRRRQTMADLLVGLRLV
jgi:hypothetical protein